MSIHILNNSLETAKECNQMHLLPCRVEYNGTAEVAKYFHSSVRDDENEQLTASFRGRPLNGQALRLPAGYTGFVLKESRRPFVEEEDRNVNITHKFKELTYWNLDKTTSVNDNLQRALGWAAIAKAVHGQADDENSQASQPGK